MGRPIRVHQNELPYHVTTKVADNVPGFFPDLTHLDADLRRVLIHNAESAIEEIKQKQNNKPSEEQNQDTQNEEQKQKELEKAVVESTYKLAERIFKRKVKNKEVIAYNSSLIKSEACNIRRKKWKEAQKKRKRNQQKKKNPPKQKFKSKAHRRLARKKAKEEIKKQKELSRSQQNWLRKLPRILVLFIITLALIKIKNLGCKVYHFVLLWTHYHMLCQTTKKCISYVMQVFNQFIAKQMNRILGRTGHFFHDRFKSNIVGTDELGEVMLRYLYQNPVRAGIAVKAEDHDCTTFTVYVFGREFLVDLSTDCPIIMERKPKDMEVSEYLRGLVEEPLDAAMREYVKRALKRHPVWMTYESFQKLPKEIQKQLQEYMDKLLDSFRTHAVFESVYKRVYESS